jgi:hypothetical protein
MRESGSSGFLGRKWIIIAVGLRILAAAWWAFRPENFALTSGSMSLLRSLRAPNPSLSLANSKLR